MPRPTNHTTLLGFDFGMRCIGVAVGQTLTQSATPLPALKVQDGIPNWQFIISLIKEWSADGLVVGLPLNMDGSRQTITFAAQKFANRLQEHSQLPVYCVDERLTTKEARAQIFATGQPLQKENIDSYAAKLILESWLRDYRRG